MSLYYNSSQTPIPVTLALGGSILIPPRGRATLVGENESSPALLAAMQKGLVVKLPEAYANRVAAQAAGVSSAPAEMGAPTEMAAPAEMGTPSEILASVEPSGELTGTSGIEESTTVAPTTEVGARSETPRRDRRK